MTRTRIAALVGIGLALAVGLGGYLLGHNADAVAWRSLRAVALESDDWGLPGFVPDAEAWAGLDRSALAPGRFPEVYWGSTLEDSADVAAMTALLTAARGRDGLPAVFQPNYVLGWREPLAGGDWIAHDLPALPSSYQRPGLWRAVAAGQAGGVWHPEFHAAWHYDPDRRAARALEPGVAAAATGRGILLFPGSEKARELGPWRTLPALEGELAHALETFRRLFGRPARAVIAPDYTWTARIERMWQDQGLRIILGKREQRNPELPGGRAGRLLKALERPWARLAHPGRQYLERNCRFEPAQAPDPAATEAACLGDVLAAWDRGQPAIIETHRVNFAHVDPALAAAGRVGLGRLLQEIAGHGPWFLASAEIADLGRHGVSARAVPGQGTVVRNGTHARRPVLLPDGRIGLMAAGREAGLVVPQDSSRF